MTTKALQTITSALEDAIATATEAAKIDGQKIDTGNAILGALVTLQKADAVALPEAVAKAKIAFYSARQWKGTARWIEDSAVHSVKIEGLHKPVNTVSGYFSRINKALELGLVFADFETWSDMVAATKPEPDAVDEALKMIFADIKKMDNPTKEKIAASLMQVLADNA
tara:strand:+ start:151 stop:654 length:504 start_codon:yes stop_codon:yes gene_type:complete